MKKVLSEVLQRYVNMNEVDTDKVISSSTKENLPEANHTSKVQMGRMLLCVKSQQRPVRSA